MGFVYLFLVDSRTRSPCGFKEPLVNSRFSLKKLMCLVSFSIQKSTCLFYFNFYDITNSHQCTSHTKILFAQGSLRVWITTVNYKKFYKFAHKVHFDCELKNLSSHAKLSFNTNCDRKLQRLSEFAHKFCFDCKPKILLASVVWLSFLCENKIVIIVISYK